MLNKNPIVGYWPVIIFLAIGVSFWVYANMLDMLIVCWYVAGWFLIRRYRRLKGLTHDKA